MNQTWYTRLLWWLCERLDHPMPKSGWIYDGCYHRDCRFCGRVISKPID